ncbi:enterobactin synthetase component D [Modicisalibacter ilicicola DSM 19980]|uniref:Enterobactin synthase component D n=1 Tax=Modicisalibacter ilicicola DSM 19980 TaxID=1121942 RepID=A0A1M4U7C2_9GAMM|nr:4'-phosphopantetheinyl transferase superfamily protein [Halomonas ilicicola]SHE52595.1 enterobactin synthetase component D [Halomonas ilicicola DSM 19980]
MPPSSIAEAMASLPDGCSALDDRWPWREPLTKAQWLALRFDRQHLAKEDLATHGIDAPASVRQAAAKRRAEFLAGRLCVREASRRLTGAPCVPDIAPSRAPLWPSNIVGSITHSGTLAAALVASASHYQGIGLDAEALMSLQRGERLAPQILTPNERDWLASLPTEQRGAFVTQVFSLKESLFKALFPLVGVRFYFQDAELIDWSDESQRASLGLLKTLSPAWPAGTRLQGQYARQDGYLLSMLAIPARDTNRH